MKTKNNQLFLISPNGLALIALAIMLAMYLIPKDVYEGLAMEKDYFHGSWTLPVFYTACIVSFLVGVNLNFEKHLGLRCKLVDRIDFADNIQYRYTFFIIFIAAIALINAYALIVIYRQNSLMTAVSSGLGALAKTHMNLSGTFVPASYLMTYMCWWGFFRYMEYRGKIESKVKKYVLLAAVFFCIGVCLAYDTITMARYKLIPLIIGIAIIYIFHKSKTSRISLISVLTKGLIFSIGIVIIFLLISFARGSVNIYFLAANLLGYGPTSVNHLSALLNGSLINPYAGHFYYEFSFLSQIPVLDKFIDPCAMLGIPDREAVYTYEFVMTKNASLNYDYNWVTAFGYYYMDLGNFVYFYLAAMGTIVGISWRSFLKGNLFGIILYPLSACSIVLWSTFNFFVHDLGGAIFAFPVIYLMEVTFGVMARHKTSVKAQLPSMN